MKKVEQLFHADLKSDDSPEKANTLYRYEKQ